ncbi:FAD-dependent monooxygenase fsr3 [Fulvia fulva]|nr:FAD-dependent monooxygenase fsr3 [Fulvia fulva]WPV17059.1 FAD-dependent monooxygenase fsr3 [Fulvia fulva]WPV32083.1 FAD-dependent monooxygenase fsr3 [Fulvia fulva]
MTKFDANINDVPLINGNGSLSQDEVRCSASTGVNVLIVGAGVGGLTAALECHRKGHSVRVLDRSTEASAGGDMFTIGSSALKMLEHYPGMMREYDEVSVHNLWMRFSKWTGEVIGPTFPFGAGAPGTERYKAAKPPMETQLQPQFHAMLYHQLERFGIEVQFDMRVMEYVEDLDRGLGGVLTDKGERFEADLIIAADGFNSKSQMMVPRTTGDARPTGRTVFRGAFPLEIAQADPLVNDVFGLRDGKDPMLQAWLGPDTHSVILAYLDKHGKNGKLAFGLAFREPEGQTRQESWHDTVSSEEMLSIIERLPGWSGAMKQLISLTPPETIVAWPLNPRNPNPVWHSPGASVLQLGDAAHPFLPTSGNGATQAIEDSVTIAECLAQAGKDLVTTAVKVHNLLRADRVSCFQLLGFANAERFQ